MASFTNYHQQYKDFITKKLGSESTTTSVTDTNISIITVNDYSDPGLQISTTMGIALRLNNLPNGLPSDENVPVELLMAGDIEFLEVADILAHCANELVKQNKICQPGTIFENCIHPYIEDTELIHLLLVFPIEWTDSLMDDQPFDPNISFLQGIAISYSEQHFCNENGPDALLDLLDEMEVDIFDLYRDPVV